MLDNPYYGLLALLRAQRGGGECSVELAWVDLPDGGEARLVDGRGEVLTPDLTACGLTLDEDSAGCACLCMRLDGRLLALCLME